MYFIRINHTVDVKITLIALSYHIDHKKVTQTWKSRTTYSFCAGLTLSPSFMPLDCNFSGIGNQMAWHLSPPLPLVPMLFWESQVGVDVMPYACAQAWLACVCSVTVGTSGSMQSQVTLKWAGITERSNGQQTESLMWESIQQVILREMLPMAYSASADCCLIPSRMFQHLGP